MADNAMKTGTLFKPEVVKELISKVQGKSVLAKLSAQTPIPFNGVEQFIFNLEGNAQIVGEGEQKQAGKKHHPLRRRRSGRPRLAADSSS